MVVSEGEMRPSLPSPKGPEAIRSARARAGIVGDSPALGLLGHSQVRLVGTSLLLIVEGLVRTVKTHH